MAQEENKEHAESGRTEHEFGFPFPPYGIQVDLMTCMTTAMDEGKIAIVESPTGTGKTLSIICSSLSWLLNQRTQTKDQAVDQSERLTKSIQDMSMNEKSELDWVSIHSAKKDLQEQKLKVNAILHLISWKEKRDAEFRERKDNKVNRMLTQVKGKAAAGTKQQEQQSCRSNPLPLVKRKQISDHPSRDQGIVSPESLDIEQVDEYVSGGEESDPDEETMVRRVGQGQGDEEEEVMRITPQIIYACRTHSQLAQFVNEVKKTAFADEIRLVSLASRANLCVNPAVSNTRSASLINDRCMDLMRKGERNKKHKCPFLSHARVSTLADEILSDVQDIEQVHLAGRQLSACPYYASRSAIREADLIVLPYNILIHEKTRASYGIDLRETIVIIDEAHNLLDTITAVHSAEVSQESLTGCMNQLRQYVTRYNKRLNAANLLYIKQLLFFMKSIVSLLQPNCRPTDDHHHQELNAKMRESAPSPNQPQEQEQKQAAQLFTVLDFILTSGIDNINLFKLVNYCEKSQLARKLFAFPTSSAEQTVTVTAGSAPGPVVAKQASKSETERKSSDVRNGKQEQQHKHDCHDEPEVRATTTVTKEKGDIDSLVAVAAPATAAQASGTNAFLSRIKSNVNRNSSQKDKVRQKAGDTSSSSNSKKNGRDDNTSGSNNNKKSQEAINDPKRLKHIVQSSSGDAAAAVVTRNEITGRSGRTVAGVSPHDNPSLTAKQQVKLSEQQSAIPTSPLYAVIEFMKCLTNPCSDGRVLVTRASARNQVRAGPAGGGGPDVSGGSSLKYFLLNSSHHFREIVTSSRSLILAGGTMKPFEEYTTLLFDPMGVPSERIITFSCGHVIPPDNILPIALSTGPSSSDPSAGATGKAITGSSAGSSAGRSVILNYSFAQRSQAKLIEETGQILVRLSALTPGGIVVFFPSYDYLNLLFSRWESSNLLQQMRAAGKRVFREPKNASEVTRILAEYCRANSKTDLGLGAGTMTQASATGASASASRSTAGSLKPGGILLSVVGGKVSEGINFNDDMCRCVVMIGMPYSNVKSAQLQEKMKYFDTNLGPGKGKFYYENLCFKAINQSIGRSIRHKDDYSVILLLDQRYCDRKDQVKNCLASWIADHLIDSRSFDPAMKSIEAFFASKRGQQSRKL